MWKEVVTHNDGFLTGSKRAREKRKKIERVREREMVKYLHMRFKMLNGERNRKSSRI